MAGALIVAPDLRDAVRIGALWCDVDAVAAPPGLDEALVEAARAARDATGADVAAARALYKAIGLDPTHTRPSSEALLRRVRKGGGLPRISPLVDVANWCSLECQLPYGLYDADRIVPPVTLRLGAPGDAYAGIRKDEVHLHGRYALFDAAGPFGNPSSDSARTMVTAATRRVMAVVFAPATVAAARMTAILDLTAARFAAFAGGRETARLGH
jgi:DNA/RNA-binding domain of Phe-tRNA-synthetase-like protein